MLRSVPLSCSLRLPVRRSKGRLCLGIHSRSFPSPARWTSTTSSTTPTDNSSNNDSDNDNDEDWEATTRRKIVQECNFLTRSLFRICLRSTRVLLQANEADERDFAQREERELQLMEDQASDPRLGMLSALPPVDRGDELHSRREYYRQYTREHFYAESDIFRTDVLPQGQSWDHSNVARSVHFLLKGEESRQWLLKDMKFDDPYPGMFDQERVQRLKTMSSDFFDEVQQREHRRLQQTGDDMFVDNDDLEGVDLERERAIEEEMEDDDEDWPVDIKDRNRL